MCKIFHKAIAIITTLAAIFMAIFISVWHEQSLNGIVFFGRLLDVMLPIFAVGALIKYLFSHCGCGCDCGCNCCCKKDKETCEMPAPQKGRKKKV